MHREDALADREGGEGREHRDALRQRAERREENDGCEQHHPLGAAHQAGLAVEAECLGSGASVRDQEARDERDEDRGDAPGGSLAGEDERGGARARSPR